jgi:hypothetical protein
MKNYKIQNIILKFINHLTSKATYPLPRNLNTKKLDTEESAVLQLVIQQLRTYNFQKEAKNSVHKLCWFTISARSGSVTDTST